MRNLGLALGGLFFLWSGAAFALVDIDKKLVDNAVEVNGGTLTVTASKLGVSHKVRIKISQHGVVRQRISSINPGDTIEFTVITNGREISHKTVVVDTLTGGGTYDVGSPFGMGPPGGGGPPGGTYVSLTGGGRSTVCNDVDIVKAISKSIEDILAGVRSFCGSSGFRGAIGLGYGWQLGGNWMVGIEGDVGFADTDGTVAGIPGLAGVIIPAALAPNDSMRMRETWDASLRGRLGYLIMPNVMVYGTGGFAWQRIELSLNCTATGICGFNAIPPFSASTSNTMTGWTAGGGVEVGLGGNWMGRAEYRYSDYGSDTITLGTPANLAVTSQVSLQTHIYSFGVSYKLPPIFGP